MRKKANTTYLAAYTLVGMRETPFAFSILNKDMNTTMRVNPNVMQDMLSKRTPYLKNNARLLKVIEYYQTATTPHCVELETYGHFLKTFQEILTNTSDTIIVPDSTHSDCFYRGRRAVVCIDNVMRLDNVHYEHTLRSYITNIIPEEFNDGLPKYLQKSITDNKDPLLYVSNPVMVVHMMKAYHGHSISTKQGELAETPM